MTFTGEGNSDGGKDLATVQDGRVTITSRAGKILRRDAAQRLPDCVLSGEFSGTTREYRVMEVVEVRGKNVQGLPPPERERAFEQLLGAHSYPWWFRVNEQA